VRLLDQFGREIKPPYIDDNAAAFVLNCPGIPEEIVKSIKDSQAYYEAFSGSRLLDADGQRIVSQKPQTVSGKAFRVPFGVGC
jgi:hypothetical protein